MQPEHRRSRAWQARPEHRCPRPWRSASTHGQGRRGHGVCVSQGQDGEQRWGRRRRSNDAVLGSDGEQNKTMTMRLHPINCSPNPMQIQMGIKVISPSQISEKKKEKRKNTTNGIIINCLTFGVPFLRRQCLKWQICKAHCFESHFCNFLERVRVSG